MSSASPIRAGRAFVELFADDSKLVRGLRRAEKRLKAFGQSIRNMGLKIAGLGAAMLAPLIGAAKAFSTMGRPGRQDGQADRPVRRDAFGTPVRGIPDGPGVRVTGDRGISGDFEEKTCNLAPSYLAYW